ncbi:PEP-CTERM sorting domain-containing protein [Streptomyces shaanxiensis]
MAPEPTTTRLLLFGSGAVCIVVKVIRLVGTLFTSDRRRGRLRSGVRRGAESPCEVLAARTTTYRASARTTTGSRRRGHDARTSDMPLPLFRPASSFVPEAD